jgi:hypothetical protein
MFMRGNRTAAGRGETTREVRLSSPHPPEWPARELVQDLIEDVCRAHGGAKALAGEQVPEGYQWIRKLAGNGDLPSLAQILRFVWLAGPEHPFREQLADHLNRMFEPDPLEAARAAAQQAGASPERASEIAAIVVEQCGPGRWIRR